MKIRTIMLTLVVLGRGKMGLIINYVHHINLFFDHKWVYFENTAIYLVAAVGRIFLSTW